MAGPDMQGAMEGFKVANPYIYHHATINRLARLLGVHPLMILCHCCMVRPLIQLESHPDFRNLVNDSGCQKLFSWAETYRLAHKYWPSPALVFETLLGPPATDAREQ